jgi:hypothetical protein
VPKDACAVRKAELSNKVVIDLLVAMSKWVFVSATEDIA